MDSEFSIQNDKVLQQLMVATPSTREAILIVYLQSLVAKALGISTHQLDVHQPLNYMGIDSLIAVKLRNQLRIDLEVDVPVVNFMEDSCLAGLATAVSSQLLLEDKELFIGKAMSNDDWLEGEL